MDAVVVSDAKYMRRVFKTGSMCRFVDLVKSYSRRGEREEEEEEEEAEAEVEEEAVQSTGFSWDILWLEATYSR
jgi:hypothetical protein